MYSYVVLVFLYLYLLFDCGTLCKRAGSWKSFAKELSPHMVSLFVFVFVFIYIWLRQSVIRVLQRSSLLTWSAAIIFRPALQLHHRHIGEDNTSPSSSEIIILTNIFFIFRLFADGVERGSSEDGDQRAIEPEVCWQRILRPLRLHSHPGGKMSFSPKKHPRWMLWVDWGGSSGAVELQLWLVILFEMKEPPVDLCPHTGSSEERSGAWDPLQPGQASLRQQGLLLLGEWAPTLLSTSFKTTMCQVSDILQNSSSTELEDQVNLVQYHDR